MHLLANFYNIKSRYFEYKCKKLAQHFHTYKINSKTFQYFHNIRPSQKKRKRSSISIVPSIFRSITGYILAIYRFGVIVGVILFYFLSQIHHIQVRLKPTFILLLMYCIHSICSFMHSLSLNIYLNSFHHLYHL